MSSANQSVSSPGAKSAERSVSKSVSVVIPTLGSEARLGVSLTAAVREVETRAIAADEILVIDDSGCDRASASVPEVLGGEEGDRRAKVRVVSTDDNLGFAAAVRKGMQESRNPLVLVLHDDVALEKGCLDELTRAFLKPCLLYTSPSPRD